MKIHFIAVLAAFALTLMSVPGWAQQNSGKTGKGMMGGQQGRMMLNKSLTGQGQMMPDMMKNIPAGDMQDMPALLVRMSRQMNEMAQAMAHGQISENHMRTMQENMAYMQKSLTEIEKK